MSDNNTTISSLQYLVIIADKKKKDKYLKLLATHGVNGINTIYGKGSMSQSAIASAFGFESQQNKVLMASLMKYDLAKEIIDILYTDYKFSKPNTGIAFSIPVDGLEF